MNRKFKNVDEENGYNTGFLQGRKRVGQKLFDRMAPDHLVGQRYSDWVYDYQLGLVDRKFERQTMAFWKDANSKVCSKSWNYHLSEKERWAFVTKCELSGCYGDIRFEYYKKSKGDQPVRTYNCGI